MAQRKEILGVVITAEKLSESGYQQKIVTQCKLEWKTRLQVEAGSNIITSQSFVAHQGTQDESTWRIELDTNYVEQVVRYLGAFLRLVETRSEGGLVDAIYSINLRVANGPAVPQFYTKRSGLVKFSPDNPIQGFGQFIPIRQLGPHQNIDNQDKLEFIVMLQLIKDNPNPTAMVAPAEKNSSETDLLMYYNHAAPPLFDAKIKFEEEFFIVDTERLSFYTTYLEQFYIPDLGENSEDQPKVGFESRSLLRKIIDFCHSGRVRMPGSWDRLISLLEKANELNIVQLKSVVAQEVFKEMTPAKFTEVVQLTEIGFIDQNIAYPFLFKYATENIEDLAQEETYKETFDEYKLIYAKMMEHFASEKDKS